MDTNLHSAIMASRLDELLKQLDAAVDAASQFPLTVSVEAPDVAPWHWLDANQGQTRLIWSDRSSSSLTFGLGEAASVEVESNGSRDECLRRCREQLRDNEELRWFGGFSFDGTDGWETFGAGRFVIPRLQMANGILTFAVMSQDDIEPARQWLGEVREASESFETRLPSPVEKTCQPNFASWQSWIDEALSLIRAEALEKIVLSRRVALRFTESLNPIALTARLNRATHDCFVFCFDFGTSSAFMGATPERLFFREGDDLQSEVIAGTRMRGQNEVEDDNLADELLSSDKDQREHDIVRKCIRQRLHKLVEQMDVDSNASILRLARKQHLRSGVRAQLKAGVDDGMLLERLHPTPAVGGYPTENALPEIARIEPYKRGWYAAPVGWISAKSAHFAVAIRSGLVEGNTLSLYSGAGIVRGSDPEKEWQEVENKIQDYMNVLGS